MAEVERWTLERDGRSHVVEVTPKGLGRTITWRCDDEVVVERSTWDDTVRLVPDDQGPDDQGPDDQGPDDQRPDGEGAGAVGLRFGPFGPARRVTWYDGTGGLDAGTSAELGVGGVDLLPEPGSRAARRDEWIDAHPGLHTARRTAAAVVGVLVPLLVVWLLGRFALPAIPWPDWDLPRIPWPDLPSIPWPQIDLPSIPWPDWQLDWTPPAWLAWVRVHAKYVTPVVVALVVAQAEVRRRRRQREAREAAGSTDRDDASERVDLTRRS